MSHCRWSGEEEVEGCEENMLRIFFAADAMMSLPSVEPLSLSSLGNFFPRLYTKPSCCSCDGGSSGGEGRRMWLSSRCSAVQSFCNSSCDVSRRERVPGRGSKNA